MNEHLFSKLILLFPLGHIINKDLRQYRIPNTDIILLLLGILLYWNSVNIRTTAILLFIEFIFFGLILYKYPEGMGTGDIKLIAVLTPLFSTWICVIIWLASITGLIHHLIAKSRNPDITLIPFGAHISAISIFFILQELTKTIFT